jgi:hypothetical protein
MRAAPRTLRFLPSKQLITEAVRRVIAGAPAFSLSSGFLCSRISTMTGWPYAERMGPPVATMKTTALELARLFLGGGVNPNPQLNMH